MSPTAISCAPETAAPCEGVHVCAVDRFGEYQAQAAISWSLIEVR
jgi:hypothetical protein